MVLLESISSMASLFNVVIYVESIPSNNVIQKRRKEKYTSDVIIVDFVSVSLFDS